MTQHVREAVDLAWHMSCAHGPCGRVRYLVGPSQEPLTFGTEMVDVIVWQLYVEPFNRRGGRVSEHGYLVHCPLFIIECARYVLSPLFRGAVHRVGLQFKHLPPALPRVEYLVVHIHEYG